MEPAMSQPQRKLTVEDYEHFPEGDRKRHELIDGEHVVTPAPFVPHQRLVGNLHLALRAIVDSQALGEVLLSPVDVVLSRHDVVQPDLLFVRSQRQEIVENRVTAAPDLAIEVLSPSSRRTDELRKRARYEAFGVEELWIVDPDIDAVRVYRRAAGSESFGRAEQLLAEAGDVLETPLLPGFSLALAAFFAGSKRPPRSS
jgi:Uma2 family endonuclease